MFQVKLPHTVKIREDMMYSPMARINEISVLGMKTLFSVEGFVTKVNKCTFYSIK